MMPGHHERSCPSTVIVQPVFRLVGSPWVAGWLGIEFRADSQISELMTLQNIKIPGKELFSGPHGRTQGAPAAF